MHIFKVKVQQTIIDKDADPDCRMQERDFTEYFDSMNGALNMLIQRFEDFNPDDEDCDRIVHSFTIKPVILQQKEKK